MHKGFRGTDKQTIIFCTVFFSHKFSVILPDVAIHIYSALG